MIFIIAPTDNTPDAPGWYWFEGTIQPAVWASYEHRGFVEIIASQLDGSLHVCGVGPEYEPLERCEGVWYGPIDPERVKAIHMTTDVDPVYGVKWSP